MITSIRSRSQLTIVARPNLSATWRTNLALLLALSIPSLVAAIGFALAGAWPILPLAGIELLALGAALRYVHRKLQYQQVITLSADTIAVDEGFREPHHRWQFARRSASLLILPQRHPWESPALALHDRREEVRLGEFLNRDDQLQLIALLRAELRVGTTTALSCRHF